MGSNPTALMMVDIGERTEAIILSELVKRGYSVFLPFGHNHRYDLVADIEGRLYRVQCKTGRIVDGAIHFNGVSYSNYGDPGRPYQGEADIFLVHCPGVDQIHGMWVDDAGQKPYLRLSPAKNGQVKRIRWARDHTLDEFLRGVGKLGNPRALGA